MLEKSDFWGIYKSKPMPPDCFHEDVLEFCFFCRGNVMIISLCDGEKLKVLFDTSNFEILTIDNSDKFKLKGEKLGGDDLHEILDGKMYIRIPQPKAFKLYLMEFGWRYFEEINDH